ncbi:MAG TPA: geranylgeranyl reductase family protein [Solirubrobacteraceae bacterium]|jgi:geranylgeranyl reductase family protein|nr:geranylgeranyl reductase family protein [Solirubrobacteraceae bacterium]
MRPYDAIVLGAGPAGSLTAYHLASAGAAVLLADRARFPRDKPCGGGLTARAVRALPFSPAPVVEREVDRLVVRLRGSHVLERRSSAPLVSMTQRIALDAFLVEQAAAAGAEFVDGARATAIAAHDATVRFGDRVARGRVVVGADGANGISARTIGVAREFGVALEGRLAYRDGAACHDRRTALIELDGIVGGYGWLFPKGDHLNVGVGGVRQEGPRLRRHLQRLCVAHGAEAERLEGVRGFRLPIRASGAVPVKGRVLLVGDAAGLIDPASGDGMYEAFVSARLAADAVLTLLAGRDGGLAAYAADLDRALGPLHALSWDVKLALERFPRLMLALADTATGWSDLEAIVGGRRPDARLSRRLRAAIGVLALAARLTGDPGQPWRLQARPALRRRSLRRGPRHAADLRVRVDADEQHRADEAGVDPGGRVLPVDVAAEARERDHVEDA